jgi:ribonuclease HI
MKYVTLNTDGSLEECKTGVFVKGGYAFWISSDVGRFTSYGKCPDSDNSMGPELVAIAKGIHFIRNHPKLKFVEKIIVNTDCVPGIDWIKNNKKGKPNCIHKGKLQNVARHHIFDMIRKGYKGLNKVEIEFRHVKAHTNNLSNPRSFVNNWLDIHAKIGKKLE